jgi:hypothetical protein
MNQQTENKDFIRRYLLGELSDEEQEEAEKRLLTDESFYQQVMIEEDELIYDFVIDDLPEDEKLSFRRHVLPVPERQQDIKFAKLLRRYVKENSTRVEASPAVLKGRGSWLEPIVAFFRQPAVGVALAAALLLVVALSVWTGIQNWRLQNQIAQLEAQKSLQPAAPQDLRDQLGAAQKEIAELKGELDKEQNLRASAEREVELARIQPQDANGSKPPRQISVATIASVLLTTGGVRGSGESDRNRVSVPRGVPEIPLDLDLAANDYRSYLAVLKPVDADRVLLSKGMLRARKSRTGLTVPIRVPAKLLTRGDYEIKLSGEISKGQYEDVSTFYFQVIE